MLSEMTHEQFEGWITAYGCDPWGEERADMRMARMCWASIQPHSRKKVSESRFNFSFGPPKTPPTPEEYKRKSMRAYLANGGVVPKTDGKAP
jgi:hypothetical protein